MSISASNQLLAMLLLSFKAQRNGKVIKSTFDKHENHRTLYSHLLECVIWYRKLVSVKEASGEKLKNSKIITKIRLLTKSKTAQSEKKVGRSKNRSEIHNPLFHQIKLTFHFKHDWHYWCNLCDTQTLFVVISALSSFCLPSFWFHVFRFLSGGKYFVN